MTEFLAHLANDLLCNLIGLRLVNWGVSLLPGSFAANSHCALTVAISIVFPRDDVEVIPPPVLSVLPENGPVELASNSNSSNSPRSFGGAELLRQSRGRRRSATWGGSDFPLDRVHQVFQ